MVALEAVLEGEGWGGKPRRALGAYGQTFLHALPLVGQEECSGVCLLPCLQLLEFGARASSAKGGKSSFSNLCSPWPSEHSALVGRQASPTEHLSVQEGASFCMDFKGRVPRHHPTLPPRNMVIALSTWKGAARSPAIGQGPDALEPDPFDPFRPSQPCSLWRPRAWASLIASRPTGKPSAVGSCGTRRLGDSERSRRPSRPSPPGAAAWRWRCPARQKSRRWCSPPARRTKNASLGLTRPFVALCLLAFVLGNLLRLFLHLFVGFDR